MTADDVRAKFEAWAIRQFGTSVQLGWIVLPNGDGYYKDEPADDCWDAYRAAHADLSGEVRELVQAASQGVIDGKGRMYFESGQKVDDFRRALAKFTHQEQHR